MSEELKNVLNRYLNEHLINLIISNPKDKSGGKKITVRPVLLKGEILFQGSEYKNNQVFHVNLNPASAAEQILQWMEIYRQLEIKSENGNVNVLISKKGKVTIKEKKVSDCVKKADLSHNRKKRYIIEPDEKVEFLVDLGIQTKNGVLINAKYDKFKQINRFLEIIDDILEHLPKDREVSIIDFGCGKSYLTFAMYYYLSIRKGYDVRITGLDLKQEVIDKCNGLSEKYQFEKLSFLTGDIAEYQGVTKTDMVVCLHACDTATDYAIHKAMNWNAEIILAVPCCQHEINGQIENELLEPIFSYGLIKERMSALLTDGLRGLILQNNGYHVQILEFIDMEHTAKNILIRAVKKQKKQKQDNIEDIMEFFHVKPTLAALQQDERKEDHHA